MKIINNTIKKLAYEVSIYNAIQVVSEEIQKRYGISSVDAEEIADDAIALLVTENEKSNSNYATKYYKSNKLIEKEVKKLLKVNMAEEELTEDIIDKNNFEMDSVEEVVEKILSTIPRKEMIVIKNRFGLEGDIKTLKELSSMLNSDVNIIKSYEKRALRMLRHPSRSRELREYY